MRTLVTGQNPNLLLSNRKRLIPRTLVRILIDLIISNSLITRVLSDNGHGDMAEMPTRKGWRMGTVHDLLTERGRQATLDLDFDRRVVEAASSYMTDEDGSIAYLFSGWTQAALPHKKLADNEVWEIRTPRVTLLVEPGRKPNQVEGLPPISVGVPYGSRARLIMLYLQTEALKTNSREVELGKSLRAWFVRLGIPPGGKSIRDVREQAERITRCRLTFHMTASGTNGGGLVNQSIVDGAIFGTHEEIANSAAFLENVKLSESFFEQLKKHPVPIEESAIRAGLFNAEF